jgi:hypothetical protein
MEGRRVDGWIRVWRGRGVGHACGVCKLLIAPLLDLTGALIKVPGQLDQGLFALDRHYGHPHFECWATSPARSLNCCRFRGHEDKIVTKELERGNDERRVQPCVQD